MKMRSVTPMRIAKTGYIVISLVLCVVGVLFIVRSNVSAVVLGKVIGIAMIVFGIIKAVGYYSKDLFRLAFQYDLELGIIFTVLGVLILIKPFDMLNIIFPAMGIAVIADALFKVRIAFEAKTVGIGSWWAILVLAILTGLIGLFLLFRPWESARVMTVILGVSLLSGGILNLCVAVSTVKIIKHQYPDYIDADYFEVNEEEKAR